MDVDAEGIVPLREAEVGDLAGIGAAGGGDDIVEAAEARAGQLDQGGRGRRLGGVGVVDLDLGGRPKLGERGVDLRVAAAAVEDEPDAALGKGHGYRRADAARAPGDDRNFVAHSLAPV